MAAQIIQSVLEAFGSYNATLERKFIQAQQRAPEPPHTQPASVKFSRESVTADRDAVAAFLRKFPQGWTVSEVSRLLLMDEYKVYHALKFWDRQGQLDRASEERGCRTKPQRYRWRGDL